MAEPLDNRGDLDAQAVEVSAVTGGVCSKDVAVDVPTGVRKVSRWLVLNGVSVWSGRGS